MSEAPPRSFDELFDALAARERRGVLRLLGERGRPATLSELACQLCTDDAVAGGLEAEEQEMRIRLHHVHAPKLAAAGLVEFDPERGLVEPTSRGDRVAPVLDWTTDVRREEA